MMSSGRSDRKSKHYPKEKEDDYDKRNRYEEGPRYYDYDKYKVEEELQEERDYLVGSRYYPESRGGRSERRNKSQTSRKELSKENEETSVKVQPTAPKRKAEDVITSRTGGAYIPPAKLRLMQASITDKSSAEYQRIAWEALKKSIHGHINKVNTSNIGVVARLLFKENIVRGRGLLCRSIIQAQSASVTFTNVYACLVAIINSKFPNIGELLLKRVIVRFKRAYKRNDKAVCISSATFIAHLINQKVAHEIVGLELVTLLVENPTDDSIEVAVAFLKEAGQKLSEVTSKGTNAIFDMLRNILHQGQLEKRVQYMIEVMFQVRKDDFATFPAVPEELDLVDEEDQFTHLIGLDDEIDVQDMLNVFKMDGEFEANEARYKELRGEILETDSDGSGSDSEEEGDSSDEEDEDDQEEGEDQKTTIVDRTETNLMALRKTIYLTIQSSLDFEECAHKLLKMEIKPGQEKELCHMFLDCCAEQRTYEKFFGLLSQRFCQVNKQYIAPFEEIFGETYSTVHRLDTNRLRNVAKLFAHLLFTDAISWAVLSNIRLNEEDTTSSSRIFIKILFQELSEYMGLTNLNARLKDPALQSAMEGLFPRDNPKNTRFAINFFTSIGLGGLTDELREHLKNIPKPVPVSQLIEQLSSSSSSESSSSSSDSEDSSSSSSSSSDSEEEKTKKKAKKKLTVGKSEKKKQNSDKKVKTDINKSKKSNKRETDENKNDRRKSDKSRNDERDNDKNKNDITRIDKRKPGKDKNDERGNETNRKDKRETVKMKEREYQSKTDGREYSKTKNNETSRKDRQEMKEREYQSKNDERGYFKSMEDEREYHRSKNDDSHKNKNEEKEHNKTKIDKRDNVNAKKEMRGKSDKQKQRIDGKEKNIERERNYHEDCGSKTIRKERKEDRTENMGEPDRNRERRRENHHHKEKDRREEGMEEERRPREEYRWRKNRGEEDMERHDREEGLAGKKQCRKSGRREVSDGGRRRDLT